ncbi:MAG: gas vesicle protein GvpJ [Halothece sp.]
MVNSNINQPKSYQSKGITNSTQSSSLADILERVLDKGIVIAGDISVSVGSTELLTIRIRLLVSSVDKARELGINWWEGDPYLSSQARVLQEENQTLQERLEAMEAEVKRLKGEETSNQSVFNESETQSREES